MTRPMTDLLRDVATALSCYASTKHAQAHVQKNPAIKAAMLEEVERIEALERDVRGARREQAEAAEPRIVYAERADYRDGDVTLVGRVFPDGVRLGCQALEPWYATGVLIPPAHPAYLPAQHLLAALAQAQAGGEG